MRVSQSRRRGTRPATARAYRHGTRAVLPSPSRWAGSVPGPSHREEVFSVSDPSNRAATVHGRAWRRTGKVGGILATVALLVGSSISATSAQQPSGDISFFGW